MSTAAPVSTRAAASTRASTSIAAPVSTRATSIAAPVSTAPLSTAAPVSTTVPVSTAAPATSQTRTTTSQRRRTTTTSLFPTPTPYDASSEKRADTQRTNKILIGIFCSLGVIVLGLIAFQLLRCYKRRQRSNRAPLPPPRKLSMSQAGYRNPRAVSVYADFPAPDFPTPDLSRPPSAMLHKDNSFGSASGIVSNSASVEMLGPDDTGPKSTEGLRQPGHAPRESTSDKSITGTALIINNDEEMGRRLSPLGSRSQSPSGMMPSRPASQAQSYRRPEPRNTHPWPNSVASTTRHAYLNTPTWQPGQRNSAYAAPNRNSYYGSGNRGAPHSPHARDRVGLMMPQPLAPELFDYALSGRHDMGLDFTQGAWGSQGSLAKAGEGGQPLAGSGSRRTRTDSWIAPEHTPLANEGRSSISDVPAPLPKDGSLPRGRSSQPDIPRPW